MHMVQGRIHAVPRLSYNLSIPTGGPLPVHTTLTTHLNPIIPQGQVVDLYVPRKCSATNRLITAKDHASVQINVAEVDDEGKMTGSNVTYAFHGGVRETGDSDDSLNRCVSVPNLLHAFKSRELTLGCVSVGSLLRTAVRLAGLPQAPPNPHLTLSLPQSSSRPGRTPSKAVLDA